MFRLSSTARKLSTSVSSLSNASIPAHKLCMIPGPVEFDNQVLEAMATPATSHIDPGFINTFGESIELLRKVFFAPVLLNEKLNSQFADGTTIYSRGKWNAHLGHDSSQFSRTG